MDSKSKSLSKKTPRRMDRRPNGRATVFCSAQRTKNVQDQLKTFADLPDVLTPADVMAYLPIGRNAVYDALKSQKIRNVRIGQKILVTKTAVAEFLGGLIEQPQRRDP